jgi:hypothetical protein
MFSLASVLSRDAFVLLRLGVVAALTTTRPALSKYALSCLKIGPFSTTASYGIANFLFNVVKQKIARNMELRLAKIAQEPSGQKNWHEEW